MLHCCISAGREKHPLPGENPGYFYAATHLHEGGRGTDPSQLCRRESHILYSCLCLRVAGVCFIVTTGRGGVHTKNNPPKNNPRYANGSLRRKHRARLRAMGCECGICHGRFGPIHYDEPSDAAHPLSFVVDEIRPVSKWRQFGYSSARAAAEDWDNLQAAHYFCNAQKRDKTASFSLDFGAKMTKIPKVTDGSW